MFPWGAQRAHHTTLPTVWEVMQGVLILFLTCFLIKCRRGSKWTQEDPWLSLVGIRCLIRNVLAAVKTLA